MERLRPFYFRRAVGLPQPIAPAVWKDVGVGDALSRLRLFCLSWESVWCIG